MRPSYAVCRILGDCAGFKPNDVIARLRLGTFVNVPKRYMYFAVPKAGCTQMKELLRTLENGPEIKLFADRSPQTRRDMFVHARPNVPLPSLVDLDDKMQREALESPDFLRMTIVRNPYSRLISAYRNNVLLCEGAGRAVYLQVKGRLPDIHNKSLLSFDEFLRFVTTKCDVRSCEHHWMGQVQYTFFPAMNFNHVGKLENLNQTLRRFAQHLGISESFVAVRKNESLPLGTATYSKESANEVYQFYRSDFELFGYKRDSWTTYSKSDSEERNSNIQISEERLTDEIIERNLIILSLYEERERLEDELQWASRLRLESVISSLARFQSNARKGARKLKRWAQGVLCPKTDGKQPSIGT